MGCANNRSEPAAAPSNPAPTPTAKAACSDRAADAAARSDPAPTPAAAADAAARCSRRTSRRNPNCPADHYAHWGDPPDSNSAECAAASDDQSPGDGRCRLFTTHRHPDSSDPGSTCTACPDCSDNSTSRGPTRVLPPAIGLTSHYPAVSDVSNQMPPALFLPPP